MKKRSRNDATDSEESSDNDSDNAYEVEKTEIETKKSVSNGLDVFEFDEYDNLDYIAIIKKNSNNSSSKDKCNLLYSKPSYANAKIEDEMEDDDSDVPLTVLQKKYRLSSSDKPIRLKEKNGVSKVMRKKKKLDSDDEDEKESEPKVVDKKKKLHRDPENEEEHEPIVVNKKKKLNKDAENEKKQQSIVVHKKKKLHKDVENDEEPESIVVHKKKKVHTDAENDEEPESLVVHKKKKVHGDTENDKEPESLVVHKKKKVHTDAENDEEPESLVVHKKKKVHGDTENDIEPESIVVHEKKKLDSDVEDEKETEPIKLHCDSKDGPISGSEDSNNKKKEVVKPILYSRSKRKVTPLKDESSSKREVVKNEDVIKKVTPVKDESSSKREVVKNEGVIKKVTPVKDESSSKRKVVKNEGVVKKVTPVKVKKNKVKSGSGTEKQILREKIKCMLLDAGWTIDYRPRRGRDYMDSVYFSPAGYSYWSIVKAYDAFQKEENSEDGKDFTPLPVFDILTRQTSRKREKEMTESDGYDSEDDNKEDKRGPSAKNGRKSRKLGRSTLLVRGSDNGVNAENDGFVSYPGKRTLLSWLIDLGVVKMSENVEYRSRRKTRAMQKGYITKDGIHCDCCNKIVTISKFEAHAGSKLRQPLLNIVLKSGKSLMQCLNDAWDKQGELEKKGFYTMDVLGDDPNDDTCGICGDGGDLICCDGCPSTFHQSCLEIQMLPQGDWHCPNCTCKFCKKACEKVGEKDASLLTCCFCQKKYHESCRPEINVNSIMFPNFSFCGLTCHELYSNLHKLFGVKHELDSGFSWSLIHRSDISKDDSSVKHSQRVQWNSMLAVAMSVMDECFLPFTDRRSGTNLIRNVVFNCGSNVSRLNYSSFFTAILEKGDEVFCAASIRIHGTQLAEMPFIGTRHRYRRQGMCRRLLSAIESALSSLQVEKLIIPAVAEHMNTWTDVFGFLPLEESHKQELKSLNMVVFPGTDMLQKPVAKQDIHNTVPQGSDTVEEDSQKTSSEKSELVSSEVKTDSGSEESCVPSDEGCSIDLNKETLHISSPVKIDDPPVEHKRSASVDSQLESNIEDSIVQVANEIIDKPVEIPTVSSSVIPNEPKVESSVKESVSVNSHFDKQDIPNTVPQGSEDTQKASSVKPELITPEVKTASGSDKSSVPLDDGCSKDANNETLHISSPVKNDDLPAEPKNSVSVDLHLQTNVEKSFVPPNEIIDQPTEIPTIGSSAIPSEHKVESSVKESVSVNSHTVPQGSDTDEEDTLNALSEKPELITSKVKTVSGSEEFSVPLDAGCSNDANKETFPTISVKNNDLPVETKLSDSVDSHLESKVEESIVQVDNEIIDQPTEIPIIPLTTICSSTIPSEPKVESPVKESAPVNSHFDKQDIPSTVPQGSDTAEEDTQKASSVKPELISSEVKTDSGPEESCVPLDDGCSIDLNETFPISSPVKNDNPPVGHKLSASVDSQLESNVEESFVQPNEVIDKPIEIPTISCSAISSEPKIESSVKEYASVNSHFDKQDIPNTAPQGSDTVEEDAQKALSEKPELISSEMKTESSVPSVDSYLKTNVEESFVQVAIDSYSGSKESSVPSDEGCSIDLNNETFPISSPVKNDDLLVEPKLSDSVDSQLESKVEESFVQPNEIIDKPIETSTISSTTTSFSAIPSEPKVESSVKESASVNSHFDKQDIPNTVPQGSVTAEKDAQNSLFEKPELISSEAKTNSGSEDDGCSKDANKPKVEFSVKESVSVNSHFDTNVQVTNDTIVQPSEIPAVNSFVPSEPKVNSNFDTNVQVTNETIVESIKDPAVRSTAVVNSVILTEPKANLSSDTNVQVTRETIMKSIELPTVISTTVVSSVILSEPKVNLNSDTNVEEFAVNSNSEMNIEKIAVQNEDGIKSDVHTDSSEVPAVLSTAVGDSVIPSQPKVNSNSDTDVQLTSDTSVESTEVPAVIPCEPKVDLNSDINEEKIALQNDDGIKDDVHTDSMVVIIDLQKNGCEITESPSNNTVSSESHVAMNGKKTFADVIVETGKHADDDSIQLPGEKEGSCEK